MSTSGDSLACVVLKAVSLLLFIFVGAYGNGGVVYGVLVKDVQRPVLNLCIASLSVADFLICVALMPFAFSSLVSGGWILDHTSCVVHNILVVYLGQVAALNITCICLERYRAISRKIFPSFSPLQVFFLLSVNWILPIPFVVPRFRQNVVYFESTGMCFNSYTLNTDERNAVFIVHAVFNVCIIVLILFSFWKIFGVLRYLKIRVSPGVLSNEEKLTVAAHVQSARTSISLVLFYMFLALPLYIVLAVDHRRRYAGYSGISETIRCTFLWFYWLQCAAKPIVYALKSERPIEGPFSCVRVACVKMLPTCSFGRGNRSRVYEVREADHPSHNRAQQSVRNPRSRHEEFRDISPFSPGGGFGLDSSPMTAWRSISDDIGVVTEDGGSQTSFPGVVLRFGCTRKKRAFAAWSEPEIPPDKGDVIPNSKPEATTLQQEHTENNSEICEDPNGHDSIEHIFNEAIDAQERRWAEKTQRRLQRLDDVPPFLSVEPEGQ